MGVVGVVEATTPQMAAALLAPQLVAMAARGQAAQAVQVEQTPAIMELVILAVRVATESLHKLT